MEALDEVEPEVLKLKGWKYYFMSILLGFLFNSFLLILVCKSLDFHYKSAFSLYFISFPSYFYKSLIIYLPLFALPIFSFFEDKTKRALLCLCPFALHILWYLMLTLLKASSFSTEFSFGYIQRF